MSDSPPKPDSFRPHNRARKARAVNRNRVWTVAFQVSSGGVMTLYEFTTPPDRDTSWMAAAHFGSVELARVLGQRPANTFIATVAVIRAE